MSTHTHNSESATDKRWAHALAIAVLTLLWVLFFWRILTPTSAEADRVIFVEGDYTVQFLASSSYQVARINQGQLVPEWNPYNRAGEPFAANLQVGAFYPPRWAAALLLGDATGWDTEDYQLEIAVHYWLASLLAYAFMLMQVGRVLPSLVGAILFSYGGYLTSYPMLQVAVLQSAVWLPLMLIGLRLSITRPRWSVGGVVLAGIGLGLACLAGHPQTIMIVTYFSAAYLLYTGYQQGLGWISIGWRLAVFGVIGVGVGMAQLLPAAEFTGLSTRLDEFGYVDKANGFSYTELMQIIWPNPVGEWSPIFIGVTGLLLAGGALLRTGTAKRFWAISALVSLLLTLGGNNIIYDFFYVFVPGGDLFRSQERFAIVFTFSMAVLAAQQLQWLLYAENQRPADKTRFTWWVGAFLVVNAALLFSTLTYGADRASTLVFVVVIAGLFAYWWASQKTALVASALVALVVVDLFTVTTRMGNWVLDTPENRPPAPVELDRLQVPNVEDIQWHVDGSGGVESYGVYWRIPDIYGIGPIALASMQDLRTIPVHRFWEVLGVRYIMLADEIPPEIAPDVELLAYGENVLGQEYQLLEVRDPRPLAHLVYDSIEAQGSAAFARQFMADPGVDLRETAILLHPLGDVTLPGERPDGAEVRDFRMETPERVTMTINTATDALLTVAIPDYPGWQATINGEDAEIVDVYAGLIGVPVPAGEDQQVVLTFASGTVRWGAIISLVTLVLGVIAAFGWRRVSQ